MDDNDMIQTNNDICEKSIDITNIDNKENPIQYDQTTIQFYVMYHLLLKSKNEQEYSTSLSQFVESIVLKDFANINNIKNLIFNLKSENLIFSYKMTLLTYVKSELSLQLTKILKLEFNCNLSFIIKKLQMLKQDYAYINSYKPVQQTIKSIGDQIISLFHSDTSDTKLSSDPNMSWYFETKIDILNKFQCLRNYFGLEMLQKLKIKNITYNEINEMSFKKLAKYHNKIILKIKKGIEKLIQLCEAFIEVEKTFVTSLMTSDARIDFDNFYIAIKSDTSDTEDTLSTESTKSIESTESKNKSGLNNQQDDEKSFVCDIGLNLNQFDCCKQDNDEEYDDNPEQPLPIPKMFDDAIENILDEC